MSLASRSFDRLRALRAALIVLAGILAIVVAGTIWTRRPRMRTPPAIETPAESTSKALQSIEKFRFTSTLAGRRTYTIVADRLTGIEGGVHLLEGVRSVEILRPDGRSIVGSADKGSFTEDAAGGGRSGSMLLEGHVRLSSPEGESFESERITYNQATQIMESPGPCRFAYEPPSGAGEDGATKGETAATSTSGGDAATSTKGGDAATSTKGGDAATSTKGGDAATSTKGGQSARSTKGGHSARSTMRGEAGRMRHDLAANHVTLDDDVTLRLMQTGAPDTIATSRNAEIDLRPQRAMLRGTPVRVTREEDWLEAPSVAIARSAAGPSRMEATPEARARVTQRDAAGRAVGPSAFLAADAILLEEPAPSAEPTRPQNQTPGAAERTITLRGHARVEQPIARRAQDDSDRRAPDNPRPGPGIAAVPDAPGKTLSAGLITLTDRGDGKGRPFRATGAVVATMPAESPGGAPRTMQCRDLVGELGADAGLAFADATGGVRIDEGARKARGETARIEDSTRIALRGGRPSVSEPERTITADAIDADDGSHTLDARGAVRTQIKPRGAPAAAGSGPEVAGLFTTGAPIAIASDTALLKERDKTATFTGRVIARQEDRALSSDTLVVDDIAKSAKADGSVNLRTFRRESDPATSAPPAAGGGKLVPVHVTSDHLRHDDAARLTVFEGRAIYREPGRTLRADRITLRGAEAADSPSETLAQGHVVVEGDGKRGTGDEALHRARERTITISGGTTPAQVTEVASGRSWRGPSLTWSLTPDSIPVAAGSLGRSTITGAAPRPSRPKRDDQADRAIPR